MKKKLTLLFTILLFTLLFTLCISNFSNAATKQTYSDTEQGIEWEYELDESNNVVNLKCKTTTATGAITIPSTIDGKTVISLSSGSSNGAFQNCAGIQSVTIPNTVLKIGSYTFKDCVGLKSITIPNNVTTIGDSVFKGCVGLESITLPSKLITLEGSAFSGCSGLKSITLPESLVSIGSYAFDACTGLKSITIPNNVTTIGMNAFRDCTGLISITLSNRLTLIDDGTFMNCSGLTSVIIPDSVTTIKTGSYGLYGAFKNCTGLTKILIPDSVASIDNNVFYNCKKLTIYGHDGKTSKEYAEANNIKFDYIENWDKESSGTDVTAPTVKSMQVDYNSVSGYWNTNSKMYEVPTGKVLTINVTFSEDITGTAPTLTVKFGEGANIALTKGTVAGSKVTYLYTTTSSDKGVLASVSLTGGAIKDKAGNTATLSCPRLEVSLGGDLVYANGTTQNVSQSGSSSSSSTTGGTSSNRTSTGTSTNSGSGSSSSTKTPTPDTTTKTPTKDTTTAPGKMPQTGISNTVIIICTLTAVVAVVSYIGYRKFRDIH